MNQPTSPYADPSVTDSDSPAEPTAAWDSAGAAPAKPSGQGRGNGHDTLHRWAGKAHQAIDRMEERLGGFGGGSAVTSRLHGYGEQTRQYGTQMSERMRDQPLQTAAVVFGLGMIASKLFLGGKRETVRVVAVPTYLPERRASLGERMRSMSPPREPMHHRLGDSGRATARNLGATAAAGVAGAKAMTSRLWDDTRQAIPSREQVQLKSQEYASMARQQVQEHPFAAVTLALGLGALVVNAVMRGWNDDY